MVYVTLDIFLVESRFIIHNNLRLYITTNHSEFQSHFFHPLSFQAFSNPSSENFFTANLRARSLIASSSTGGSVSTVWIASANSSGDVAWYPGAKAHLDVGLLVM